MVERAPAGDELGFRLHTG